MKSLSTVRPTVGAVWLALLVTNGSVIQMAQAAPAAPPAKGAKPAKKGGAIKRAEAILGKPLTATQKDAIKAASKERQDAVKAATLKYQTKAAKILGISLTQYQAKDKAIKAKEDAAKKAGKKP